MGKNKGKLCNKSYGINKLRAKEILFVAQMQACLSPATCVVTQIAAYSQGYTRGEADQMKMENVMFHKYYAFHVLVQTNFWQYYFYFLLD